MDNENPRSQGSSLLKSLKYRDEFGRKNPYFTRRIVSLTIVLVGFCLLIWLAFVILGAFFDLLSSLFASDQAPTSANTAAVVDSPFPDFAIQCVDSSQAAIGTVKLGLIATCGDENAYSIASITKTITALVVTDQITDDAQYDATFEVDEEALQDQRDSMAKGGTFLDVSAGQEISKRDLLEGMLLFSANNVADMFARSQFGTLENYKKAAHEYLDAHDLQSVQLGNDASGLDDLTKVTPRDLFKIGKLVTENKTVSEVVNLSSTYFPTADGPKIIYNGTNELLQLGFTGVKIGYTGEAGRCLLYTHPIPGSDDVIIGLTLGDKNDAHGFSFLEAQRHEAELMARITK